MNNFRCYVHGIPLDSAGYCSICQSCYHSNTIDILAAKVAELEAELQKREWVPVSERLPEPNVLVDLWVDGRRIADGKRIVIGAIHTPYGTRKAEDYFMGGGIKGLLVTYWMSQPIPPKEIET